MFKVHVEWLVLYKLGLKFVIWQIYPGLFQFSAAIFFSFIQFFFFHSVCVPPPLPLLKYAYKKNDFLP